MNANGKMLIENMVPPLAKDAMEYSLDTWQRWILFFNVMRQRGNNYLQHKKDGKPPVLIFDYEVIMDGRDLETNPVGYALARIIPEEGMEINELKRPVIVMDPRAGHGPGVGGSKLDSEIGMALRAGHQAYVILFYPEPIPGQTIAHIERAESIFIEEVAKRHPKAARPAVIGNCQAGWAAALLSANRPNTTGPLVLMGAPLSYWGGTDGFNIMRYKGGLLGGAWASSFMSDIGNGKFDGASLVSNFESLNPANTYWKKEYNLYANIDTEEKRYLDFERWWGGFYHLRSEEIQFIVSGLFVGNKLQQGKLQLEDENDKAIDLKELSEPIVVFCSKGDNITPPQQALNWIEEVYGSAEEVKRQKKVIIYLLHETIGHLGIFVAGSVAKKEHRAIIRSLDRIQFLPPGLYEMVVHKEDQGKSADEYSVRFEERDVEDIHALSDKEDDETVFARIANVSEWGENVYGKWVSPWVKQWSNDLSSEWVRQMHPLRMARYGLSDLNPFMAPIKEIAPTVKMARLQASDDNIFKNVEKSISSAIATTLDLYRDQRDMVQEMTVKLMYSNPFIDFFFGNGQSTSSQDTERQAEAKRKRTKELEYWKEQAEKGGLFEAVIRIIVAVSLADGAVDIKEIEAGYRMLRANDLAEDRTIEDFKRAVIEQSRILDADRKGAIKALAKMVRDHEQRRIALSVASVIAEADGKISDEEKNVLREIITAFYLDSGALLLTPPKLPKALSA